MAAGFVPDEDDGLNIPSAEEMAAHGCDCAESGEDFTWKFNDEIIDETPQG